MKKHGKLEPIHPGEILFEESCGPSTSASILAVTWTSQTRVTVSFAATVQSRDTALRLAIYFQVAPELWLNLQSEYDLRMVKGVQGASPKQSDGAT